MLKYDIEAYRRLFPVTQTGTIYLNHAATAPLSTRVTAAMGKYLQERSQASIDNFGAVHRTVEETRGFAGRLLNAAAERIAFFDNTSNALNLLAAGLKWHPGDRILLNDLEFPANVYPFLNLKRQGVEIDFVENRGGRVQLEDIEHKLTPRTRLLSISHVQFLSGFRADLEVIGEMCRRKSVLFCVDAIQSAGVMPVDVEKMHVDFLAAGGQKWLMAPHGTGFAFVSVETQEKLNQAYLGWTSMRNFFGHFTDYAIDLAPTARRYENGTMNHAGITGMHESLATLLEVGIEAIEEHVLDLGDRLTGELTRFGMEIYADGRREERSGITSVKVSNPEAVLAELAGQKVEAAVRQGWVRVSPHFYNTEDEILKLAGILERTRGKANGAG